MKGILFTVNYNNYEITLNFIKSLELVSQFADNEIIIIDNTPIFHRSDLLNDYVSNNNLSNITIFTSDVNKGYFGTISYCIKSLDLNLVTYQYSIICNNDIVIRDKNFFDLLSSKIDSAEVIAPNIISLLSSKNQNPYRETEITNLQKIMYRIYFYNYYLACFTIYLWTIRKFLVKNRSNENYLVERDIYSCHGSFIIFSSDYFKKGGYIDGKLFLYGEEESITGISKMLNFKIRYVPCLHVFHDEHKTTNSKLFTKRIFTFQKNAYLYIRNTYNNIY